MNDTDGGYFFSHNFDWQICDIPVVTSYPREGYASVSTVNLGFIRQGAGSSANMLTDEMLTVAALYAPLDGMNEKGLCVSVNMIQDNATIRQDTGKADITTTTAIRLMLDKAAAVEEAPELLRQYDLHASGRGRSRCCGGTMNGDWRIKPGIPTKLASEMYGCGQPNGSVYGGTGKATAEAKHIFTKPQAHQLFGAFVDSFSDLSLPGGRGDGVHIFFAICIRRTQKKILLLAIRY